MLLFILTLLHSEWPKLHTILDYLNAIGLRKLEISPTKKRSPYTDALPPHPKFTRYPEKGLNQQKLINNTLACPSDNIFMPRNFRENFPGT